MINLRYFLTKLSQLFGSRQEKHSAEIDFGKLERVLHYTIHNRQLFREALSHRSYLQIVNDATAISNERLEFLGDSVLNLVVGEYLFHQNPGAEEGELTKVRARFVNRKALSIYARELRLSDFMLMNPHIAQISNRGMETILSDAYEAIIGAIYLDGGYQQAKLFIDLCLSAATRQGILKLEDENFKSQLLEQSQADGRGIPRYVTVQEEGPDHDRTFTVEVFIGKKPYGVGIGKNKKDAEQAAAEQALKNFNHDEEIT